MYSAHFDATYHSIHGAVIESDHVFIKNGLLFQFENLNQHELHILEMGFGTGLNAFLTYITSKNLQLKINYHSIEAFPVLTNDALTLNYSESYSEEEQYFFRKLHECEWNKDVHISDNFNLHKHQCLLDNFKSDLKFDVIYYDAFSPTDQPELWTTDVFKKMYDLLTDKGILVTYCAQGQMKRNMKEAGFLVKPLPGPPGKREMTRAIK